jgi:hypothetical protein
VPGYDKSSNPFFISYNNCLKSLYLHNSANLEVRKLDCFEADLTLGFVVTEAHHFRQKTVGDFFRGDKDSTQGKYAIVCASKRNEILILRFNTNL